MKKILRRVSRCVERARFDLQAMRDCIKSYETEGTSLHEIADYAGYAKNEMEMVLALIKEEIAKCVREDLK